MVMIEEYRGGNNLKLCRACNKKYVNNVIRYVNIIILISFFSKVNDDDTVVICDVRHSKHMEDVQTIHGRGTPLYLAPELRGFSHPHSTAFEFYSFGLMLWVLYHRKLI